MLESKCVSHTFEAFGLRSIMATGSYNLARLDTGRERLVGIPYSMLTWSQLWRLSATRFLSIDGYLLTSLLLMAEVIHRHCDLSLERDQSFAAIRLKDVYRRDFSLSFQHFGRSSCRSCYMEECVSLDQGWFFPWFYLFIYWISFDWVRCFTVVLHFLMRIMLFGCSLTVVLSDVCSPYTELGVQCGTDIRCPRTAIFLSWLTGLDDGQGRKLVSLTLC